MATQKPAKKVAAKKPTAKPAVKSATKVAVKVAIKAPAKAPVKAPASVPAKTAVKPVAALAAAPVPKTTDIAKKPGKVAKPPVKAKPKATAKPVSKTSVPEKTIPAGGYPQGQTPRFVALNETPKKVGVHVSEERVKFKDLVAKAKQLPTFGRTVPAKTGQAKILANMQASLMKTSF